MDRPDLPWRGPETGKKRYHSESVKGTKAQAERRLTELLRQVDTGSYVEPTHLTIAEYLEQWMRDYAETLLSQCTFERMGHSTIAITANVYPHVLPTVQQEAAQRFGDAWSGIETSEKSGNGKLD